MLGHLGKKVEMLTTELEKKLVAYLREVPIDLGGDIAAVTLTPGKAGEMAKGTIDVLKKEADKYSPDTGNYFLVLEEG